MAETTEQTSGDAAEIVPATVVEAIAETAPVKLAQPGPSAQPEASVEAEAALEFPAKARRARKPAAAATVAAAPVKKARAAKAAPKVSAQPKAEKPRAAKLKTTKARSAPAKAPTISQLKDKIMATKKTADFTEGFKTVVADAQAKAQDAFEKSSAAFGEAGEFTKGNVEALVESGKILASGLQEMGSGFVAEAKTAFETMSADAKQLAAVKSPADFLKLQSELLRRNFDAAIAYGSKNSEAVMKLTNDAFAPISGRVSVAVEKAKKAA